MTTMPSERVRRISATQAADLIVRHRRGVLRELALYDVRDRTSFERGHIEGAEHLDDAGLGGVLQRVPRRTPIVVYCYHGNASQTYGAAFADFRFAEVYSVDGGFEPLALALTDHDPPHAKAESDGVVSDALNAFLSQFGFERTRLDSPREQGLTPLMRAALAGRADLVDELLRLGANVRLRNADGNNALWLACVANSPEIIQRLLRAGVDVDNRNDTGATALMYAASSGKADMVALLLKAGSDADLCNQDDARAVDLASSWECLTLLRHWTGGERRKGS